MKTTLTNIALVGAGSCLGGMARYVASRLIQTAARGAFPWGTFFVNITGCFLIGLVYGAIDQGFHPPEGVRLFLTVGFCGGFTTFSTFVHENTLLFGGSGFGLFLAYALSSFTVGFLLLYLGCWLAKL